MAEPEVGIYARCCRLCLSDNTDNLNSVFGDSERNGEAREKILHYLSVDIKENDRLSTMICNPCLNKVLDWSEFKKCCFKNQSILEGWANEMQDIHNMSFQVKEEVLEEDERMEDDDIEIVNSNITRVKAEPIDYENGENHSNGDLVLSEIISFRCKVCKTEFGDKTELEEHEITTHSIQPQEAVEGPDGSIRNSTEQRHSEKVEFAAGLRLIQSDSTPITMEPLSAIELSYIEKCKAMVTMYRTLICACHNVAHPNVKGLLSHLRALRIWFPVFTCYHCMITFTDRSTSGKHMHKCPNKDLDTLVKLSNLRKRSILKTRLYQNYKCVKCRFMFSFHEDFCKHIDEEHCEESYMYYCSCQKTFDNVEDFKDHIYVSCMVEYYCDICFIVERTLKDFIKHAEQNHDNSPGFILLQDDNYKKRSFTKVEPRENKEILGKRRSSTYGRAPPDLEPQISYKEEPDEEDTYYAPTNSKNKPTKCLECDKVYSCHANMMRHYRSHLEKADDDHQVLSNGSTAPEDSLYRCPDCQVMYNSKDWEIHKESHEQKKCLECNKIFLFQTELEQHRSVHLNLKLYRDPESHSYKSTMLSPNSESPICDICNVVCENFEDLESHKLSHEDLGDEDPPKPIVSKYSCIPCDKHYTGYSGLWEHNRKKHADKQITNHTYPRQCDECEKVITSGSAFASHKQMHRRLRDEAMGSSSPNSQDEVPARSKSKKNFSQDDEDYHTCKRCFKVFSTRYNLKMHMKLHGINLMSSKTPRTAKKFTCNICHMTLPNAEALQTHQEEEHDDMPDLVSVIDEFNNRPYVFTCDICVQTFTTKNALKQHKEQHAAESGVVKVANKTAAYCKYCKIPFQSVEALDEHMVNEHDELPKNTKTKQIQGRGFSCKICSKTFVSQPAMYAHQGWHKRAKSDGTLSSLPPKKGSIPVKPKIADFSCPTCHQELPNDTALRIHILEKHGNIAALLSLKCEPCNQEFATSTEFENHKKLHEIVESQKKVTTFSCQFCTASFNKHETLQTHIRLSHGDKKVAHDYQCPHCGRSFDKQASLTNHIKVHEKQKAVVGSPKPLYFCSICSMGFHVPKDLRTHTITAHPF